MEENFQVGHRRHELREEKAKLEGFSRRLAELQRQAHDADLQPEAALNGAGGYYHADVNRNGNVNGNSHHATVIDENDYMDESGS